MKLWRALKKLAKSVFNRAKEEVDEFFRYCLEEEWRNIQ